MTIEDKIKAFKQPKGGYLPVTTFEPMPQKLIGSLCRKENIPAFLVDRTVVCMTDFLLGREKMTSFLKAMTNAPHQQTPDAEAVAKVCFDNIKGLDDESIVNAVKLITFEQEDTNAFNFVPYYKVHLERATIINLMHLINRSVVFFKKNGELKRNIKFTPADMSSPKEWVEIKENFGGYSPTINDGDCAYLTEDTIWDFRVSYNPPNPKHTLLVASEWVMSKHSGRAVFGGVKYIGIYNPRFNIAYRMPVADIPKNVISVIENQIIRY